MNSDEEFVLLDSLATRQQATVEEAIKQTRAIKENNDKLHKKVEAMVEEMAKQTRASKEENQKLHQKVRKLERALDENEKLQQSSLAAIAGNLGVEVSTLSSLPEADPPNLSLLEGLPVLADGKIQDVLGNVIGKLVDQDMFQARKCYSMKFLCDEEGILRNSKGKIVARAETISPDGKVNRAP